MKRRSSSRSTRKPSRKNSRTTRSSYRLAFLITVALVLIVLIIIREQGRRQPPLGPGVTDTLGVRIIDGDTFEKSNGQRVRLLAIDTPEKGEPYYREAGQLLGELIRNRQLRYVHGPEEKDRYGRELAFIYAGTTFVNGALAQAGLARAYMFSDDLLYSEPGQRVCAAQREALSEHRGIWSLPSAKSETRYFGNPRSLRFHRPDCSSIRNSDTLHLVRRTSREQFLEDCYSPCRNCDP